MNPTGGGLRVDLRVTEIPIAQESEVLRAGVDVVFQSADVRDADGRARRGAGQELHQTDCPGRAPTPLVEARLLVGLRSQGQPVEVVPGRVLLK